MSTTKAVLIEFVGGSHDGELLIFPDPPDQLRIKRPASFLDILLGRWLPPETYQRRTGTFLYDLVRE